MWSPMYPFALRWGDAVRGDIEGQDDVFDRFELTLSTHIFLITDFRSSFSFDCKI